MNNVIYNEKEGGRYEILYDKVYDDLYEKIGRGDN